MGGIFFRLYIFNKLHVLCVWSVGRAVSSTCGVVRGFVTFVTDPSLGGGI